MKPSAPMTVLLLTTSAGVRQAPSGTEIKKALKVSPTGVELKDNTIGVRRIQGRRLKAGPVEFFW